MRGQPSRVGSWAVALAALVTVAGCVSWLGPVATPQASRPLVPVRTLAPLTTLEAVPGGAPGAIDPGSGLSVVALSDLPPEAAATVERIEAGGPLPNAQDGAVFENRERLLPTRERGYYREYTVATPGATDRGARRIVIGRDGEMYWTADHYDSFAWIAH